MSTLDAVLKYTGAGCVMLIGVSLMWCLLITMFTRDVPNHPATLLAGLFGASGCMLIYAAAHFLAGTL